MRDVTILPRPIRRYNPNAYVRGGAPLAVALGTQRAGFANPGAHGVPVRPSPVRPRIIPTATRPPVAPVDPLWTRANNQVMQFMNPMLSRLAAQRVAAEANARQAQSGHTAALQGALVQSAKPMDAAYERGVLSASAVNDALANRLNGQGGAAQTDLSAKLAQIGARDNGEIAQTYKDASNAGFATGAADIQSLIARRAEGAAYQAKLPGIAALEGNRDLQQALGEMRENFGKQEQDLTDSALEKSFDLWGTLRGEKREDVQNKAEQAFARYEATLKQKMALQALAATATTKAEKMAFDAQQAALDRQLKADIAQLNSDTRLATDNGPAAPKVTGAANQPFISVNGQPVKNPNWHGTWKGNTPVAPKPGQTTKTNPVVQNRLKGNQAAVNVRRVLLNPQTSRPRQWVVNAPTWSGEVLQQINGAIEQAGIDPNSPLGIKQRKAAFKMLGVPTGKNGNPSDKARATP